jgi:hypothetical protein
VKRADALAILSRDHHHGLVVALRLTRATAATAGEARAAFLEFWAGEGREHFRIEEEVLLPAFAAHEPPTHPAVVRVLTDHVDIRRRAGDLAAGPEPALDALHELGATLHDHIRHEERVLFALVEDALSDEELAALASAVEASHR